MPQINIITTPEEQQIVIEALRELQGVTAPITLIAKQAKLNPNRVRYIVTDLCEANKIRRVATKAINKHYVRYSYEVLV